MFQKCLEKRNIGSIGRGRGRLWVGCKLARPESLYARLRSLYTVPGCFRSTAEAYKAVGRALEWDILGKPEDETAMAQYQGDSGTLAERRWEALTFHMPEKEESSFWLRLWSSGVAHPPHFAHPLAWGMQS